MCEVVLISHTCVFLHKHAVKVETVDVMTDSFTVNANTPGPQTSSVLDLSY